MKLFIILILLVIFLALLYLRLRPYIKMARRMFGIVRDARGMSQNAVVQPLRSETVADNKLVRCDACGTWIPASRAVRLRTQTAAYCSHECLERAADAPARARRSSR